VMVVRGASEDGIDPSQEGKSRATPKGGQREDIRDKMASARLDLAQPIVTAVRRTERRREKPGKVGAGKRELSRRSRAVDCCLSG